MGTTIEQWLSREYSPMGTTDELNEAQELAWDLLRQAASICHTGDDGCVELIIDHMCNSTFEEACNYFVELGWLEKMDGRTYRDIKHKTVKEQEGENGDGI